MNDRERIGYGFRDRNEYLVACDEQRKQRADILNRLDCPHLRNQPEGVALCKFNEMRPCIYEVGEMFCEEDNEFIAENTR